MNIFLTGATGFVGRNYLHWVRRHQPQAQITCLVRDPQKAAAQWPDQPRQIRWLAGDLLQPHTYQAALQAADWVLHAAALVSLRNGPEFYEQNTEATRQLLAVLATSDRLQRMIHVSSISAIDRPPNQPALGPLTDESPSQPNTDYGHSKWQAEEAVRASGLPYVILRPAYIYGPYPRPHSSMDKLIRHVAAGAHYTRYPFPGRASAIYVEDLAEILWLAGEHPAVQGQSFFICDPQPVRVGQAFADVARALQLPYRPLPRTSQQLAQLQSRLLYQQPHSLILRILFEDYFYCSPAHWYRLTNSQPRFGYAEGLARTAAWVSRQGALR
jgi:nucleoside-diphosphate-sugar epimerase